MRFRSKNIDFKELNSSVSLGCDDYCKGDYESFDLWTARSNVTRFAVWAVDICAARGLGP
jgi:hypothetical protein